MPGGRVSLAAHRMFELVMGSGRSWAAEAFTQWGDKQDALPFNNVEPTFFLARRDYA